MKHCFTSTSAHNVSVCPVATVKHRILENSKTFTEEETLDSKVHHIYSFIQTWMK